MSEFSPHQPREGVTGLKDKPCLVFGNGVEIETRVYAKTTTETQRERADGLTVLVLPQRIGSNLKGMDIVKVHFVPETSLARRANDPDLVSPSEKSKIGLDCLEGFLSLADALKNDGVKIENHSESEDFYLFADTYPQFAAFLKRRCGFRGTAGGSQTWIKKSEFISEKNMALMRSEYQKLKQSN